MAVTFNDLWRRALVGTLTDRSISVSLGRGNISALEAQALRGVMSGAVTPAEALNILATAVPPAPAAAPVVPAATPAGPPITLEGVMRMIAAGTAFNADTWRKFIGEGPGRALPKLETAKANIGDGKNITFMRQWWARIQREVAAGNMAALVAEAEAAPALGATTGWTSGDLKLLYKVIAHNSQLSIFQGAIADASASEKSIQNALDKNFGVYSDWNWNFSRWGQTWGTIVQSFVGLVGLVKKIKEGSLEAKDVWDYRDKDAFQATFEELEDQPYLQDLRAWDPDEFVLLHSKDMAGNRPAGEPLFWSEPLARYIEEEVFSGVIKVTKDNFLRHKDLADEVRAKQKAIRRALHVVETYVDQPQKMPIFPDLKPFSVVGFLSGFFAGWALAGFLGVPADKGGFPLLLLGSAIAGVWVESLLRWQFGWVGSMVATALPAGAFFWTSWIIDNAKSASLRNGIPSAQVALKIFTTIPKGWVPVLLVVAVTLLLTRRGRR